MNLRTRLAAVAASAALAALVLPAVPAAADSTCWSSTTAERGFTASMNTARRARSLGPLTLDPELSRVARQHTKAMIERRTLFHTPRKTLGRRVTNWVSLGENVGAGGTVTSLHTAFMNSTTHRDNILNGRFNHVGVGTMKAGGFLWVTVVFEAHTDPGTTLPMPGCS